MYTYHLFVVQDAIFKTYSKNPKTLYVFLEKLYHLNCRNFNYGLSVYQQLCIPIHVKLLSNYIIEKVPAIKVKKNTFKMLSFYENTTLELHYANIVIKTDATLPAIYHILQIYSEHILVCAFVENKCFWLSQELKKLETIGKKHI